MDIKRYNCVYFDTSIVRMYTMVAHRCTGVKVSCGNKHPYLVNFYIQTRTQSITGADALVFDGECSEYHHLHRTDFLTMIRNSTVVVLPSLEAAEVGGKRGISANIFCPADPCVASSEAGAPRDAVWSVGNLPWRGEERDRQGILTPALRRLVLGCSSASGRQNQENRPVFPELHPIC